MLSSDLFIFIKLWIIISFLFSMLLCTSFNLNLFVKLIIISCSSKDNCSATAISTSHSFIIKSDNKISQIFISLIIERMSWPFEYAFCNRGLSLPAVSKVTKVWHLCSFYKTGKLQLIPWVETKNPWFDL